jgi:hypothetical protein
MIKPFQFQADGRSFTCTIENLHGAADDAWWWFEVSGDRQRYASFRAARADTRESVQERVAQFYADRLIALARPNERGSHWGRRPVPVVKPGLAPGAAPARAPEGAPLP